MTRMRVPVLIVLAGLARTAVAQPVPGPAGLGYAPQPTTPTTKQPPTLRNHLLVHAAFVVGGGAIWIFSETAFKSSLAPDVCRWCQPDGFDTWVRDGLRWKNTGRADTLSSIAGFTLTPAVPLILTAAATFRARGPDDGLDDALSIIEAGVAASLIDQGVKFAAGRQRPFVHFNTDPTRPHDSDDNLSFFSGHTSLAFSIAVAGGTVSSHRHQKIAPWVWGLGLAFASTSGYLRIAADKHYATDVLAGGVVGAAVGYFGPTLFHTHELVLSPTPGGIAISGTF